MKSDSDPLSTESAHKDGTEHMKKLQVLRNFVRTTKRRNLQLLQPEEPNQVGTVPLFTEFLKVAYDEECGIINGAFEQKNAAIGPTVLSEDDDEEISSDIAPRRMIIDVDVELGLKPRTAPIAFKSSSDFVKPEIMTSNMEKDMQEASNNHNQSTNFLSPHEEGYYEGCISLALADDHLYLSELQCWVRQNLELFSATTQDSVRSSLGGRRSSVALGKIGVRCIHCSAAAKSAACSLSSNDYSQSLSRDRFEWPTAAFSYPFNMNGLYSTCTQKPNLHFNHCPYLPQDGKAQLKALTQVLPERPTKRVRSGVPSALYYVVAAKRIGLIEVDDGLRFGRDLTLDPLPFETILTQVQDEKRESSSGVASNDAIAEPVLSASAADAASHLMSRLAGDEASEQVLAEAVAEPDDPSKLLARSGDKSLVSDYIFLTIKQMAICNAVPVDFATRGKKTKSMRVGFGGFCCRHCSFGRNVTTIDYSCRSFCSAPDNLSSAISNSFSTHLSKCSLVPSRIKKALAAYRKIHQRQMSQLPYGSQRRLFHEMWRRLRNADKSESDMEAILSSMKPPPAATEPDEVVSGDPVHPSLEQLASPSTTEPSDSAPPENMQRSAGFPVSSHSETSAVLKHHVDNWDPKDNDCLIVPEDMNLVSDYVFLTMRQLKVAIPTPSDGVRGRRAVPVNPSIPGVCCVHCSEQPNAVMPSGRSFPSAPDNFASALNTSLYNHMQACPFISEDLKRALADVRKLHSAQCASIKFGSQRRYFNRLYDRLKRIQPLRGGSPSVAQEHGDYLREVEEAGFLQLPSRSDGSLFVCRLCNMVPLQFRSAGSFYSERPSSAKARDHSVRCARGKLDLTLAVQTFRAAAVSVNQDPIELISSDAFKSVLRFAIGGNELFDALHQGIQDILARGNEGQIRTERADLWRNFSSAHVNTTDVKKAFGEFISSLGYESGTIEDYPEIAAFLMMVGPSMDTTISEGGLSS